MKDERRLILMPRLGIAFLLWKRFLQKKLVPYGVTLKQHYLLKRLCTREYMYPSEIADRLYCDRPTATVIINNIVKKGWAVKARDSENRRQTKVVITEKGRRKYEEIEHALDTGFDPMGCFTPAELETLGGLLDKLKDHLSELPDG